MDQNRKNAKGDEYFCKALFMVVQRPIINNHHSGVPMACCVS